MSDVDEPTIKRPKLFASGERPLPADGPGQAEQPEETEGTAGEAHEAEAPQPESGGAFQPGVATVRERRGRQTFGAGRWRVRRTRRFWIVAIAVGVVVVVGGLCAGGIAVVSAVHSAGSNAADAREAARQRDTDCLELETRLNHLIPPGATAAPAARAVAVQDENAAVRIYVARLGDQRAADAWRQLLDARTAYVEALQAQAKSRTPAFFVAPRTPGGRPLSEQLTADSPASCAGPVRRLAAPDL